MPSGMEAAAQARRHAYLDFAPARAILLPTQDVVVGGIAKNQNPYIDVATIPVAIGALSFEVDQVQYWNPPALASTRADGQSPRLWVTSGRGTSLDRGRSRSRRLI